jgi:hypothetical protein
MFSAIDKPDHRTSRQKFADEERQSNLNRQPTTREEYCNWVAGQRIAAQLERQKADYERGLQAPASVD